MGPMRCPEVRHALGVYVLGAIDPAERSEVDAHLADCAACQGELAGLAGLPALLARLPAEMLEDGPADPDPAGDPDPGMLDGLFAGVAARRRRFRRLVASVAAGVVVVVAVGVTGAYMAGEAASARPPDSAVTLSARDAGSDVSGKVTLTPRRWGTSLTVRLTGVPKYTTCSLVAVGEEGNRSVAASWHISYDGGVDVDGAVALTPAQIAEFEVVTPEGQRLLTIPMPDTGQVDQQRPW